MIYLAASLKPQDIHVCEHVEKLCKGVKLDLYSPRSEGLLESMTEEERGDSSQVIFDTNIQTYGRSRAHARARGREGYRDVV